MFNFRLGVPALMVVFGLLLVGCPPALRLEVTPTVMNFEPPAKAIPTSVNPQITDLAKQSVTQPLTIANKGARKALNFEIVSDRVWLSADPVEGTLKPGQSIVVQVSVAYAKAVFSAGALAVTARDPEGEIADVIKVTVNTGTPNYLTQDFVPDLEGKMVKFAVNGAPDFYRPEIADLPTGADANYRIQQLDPAASLADYTPLPSFLVMDPIPLSPLDGKKVWLYGKAYDTVYVGSDGRITFEEPGAAAGDGDFGEHFATPGISGLFSQFGTSGAVYAIQLDDRLLIVYDNVPQLGKNPSESSNTFQVELFFDDANAAKALAPQQFAITWFGIDDDILAIIGLSDGSGTGGQAPPDFTPEATDLRSSQDGGQSTPTYDTNTPSLKASLDF